jgi:carboxypeptidase PM20D1
MKKILLGILGLLIVLITVILIKTVTHPFGKIASTEKNLPKVSVTELAVQRFAGGLKIPTVSYGEPELRNYRVFDSFRVYLRNVYPTVFSNMEFDSVNTHSMVFRWKGKDAKLPPILFLSHYDVVPPNETEGSEENDCTLFDFDLDFEKYSPPAAYAEKWDYPPFGGVVTNGRIYGRGAIDMKNMLFALLEAAEKLIKEGFVPPRDIYFSFGHDEEIGGIEGATKVVEHFIKAGIRFEAVYDEGGIVAAKGSVKGVESNVALIGVAEKGFASYSIKVKGMGGHSSMPPLQSSIGKAAIIMQRLEKNQMPAEVITPVKMFFNNIGGSMSFTNRMAIANLWLFKPFLINTLTKQPSTNAMVRTTTALTRMKGSDADNVLAPVAEFVVNFRILPGNTVQDVTNHVKKACEGFDVEISFSRPSREPSNISPDNTRSFAIAKEAIEKIFPNAIITPYITIGGTDAIKYEKISNNVYRFLPMILNEPEQRTQHNYNESLSIENYARMILYFEYLMKNYS